MPPGSPPSRSEEHTSELQSQSNLVCRLLLEKKKKRGRVPWLAHGAEPVAGRPRSCGSRQLRPHVLCVLARGRVSCSDRSFFFTDPAPTEIYTLSLHDALPI